ncbi:MarR family winged helix-turn-helix transcriptional regulator [Chryseobacterium balustinum]|uniref:DNA-binding transcriptional regulator, MarR family n=1 Tax=Chryseobacterium balustinum TaxID=246 RepID=A0ABY1L6M0_9FLAO|nr:winged helix DNA-binding protein [Chryseobacterium balustinum]AZB29069.1 MarR family transcriptional regulator [Chryseobacterium balustinum]SKB59639.1 DNA-binding transcriptional regulator, MarR family [Chryseobacterium balustinum]
MNYNLAKDVIQLLEQFDSENKKLQYTSDIEGFKTWVQHHQNKKTPTQKNIVWEGKESGRSPESVISTLLVHMNRYAKTYSKSAIAGSEFSTQEEFIYLINLKSFGEMSKTELIKKNIQDKPVGNLIITRLIKNEWVKQTDSKTDKRTKIIAITQKGLDALEKQMANIRNATKIVSGNLNEEEKYTLIELLHKLDHFHNPIFGRNIDSANLIDTVFRENSFNDN